MTHADDQALTLNEILDLMDTLQETIGAGMTAWAALRAVLDWGGRNEFFTMAEAAPAQVAVMTHEGAEAAALADLKRKAHRDALRERLMPKPDTASPGEADGTNEIPAGPHDDADGHAAGEASAAARIEGPADRAPEAPVTPVAGDGTPFPAMAGGRKPGAVASNFSAPAWTEEQDRTAIEMKLAGRSNREIAEAVGRPVKALTVRMSTKLKARLAQARAEIAGERDSETAGEPAPEGGAESGVTAAAQFAEQAPAGAAEETGDSPAAAAPTPAPALRVVPAEDGHGPAPMPPAIISADLNALGYKRPWTPELDRKLARDMTGGASISEVAADLGFDSRVVKDRWRTLSDIGHGMRSTLLEVLDARADEARMVANMGKRG